MMNMKKLDKMIAKMIKAVKPHLADYRVSVTSMIGKKQVKHIHYAWTQAEALEWVSLQCADDLCIISSSWFSFRVASANGKFMKIGV